MTDRVIFSVVAGGYDLVLPPRIPIAIPRILFADRPPHHLFGWEVRPLHPQAADLDPVATNRWMRFRPHVLLPEARTSLYLDANIRLIGQPEELFDAFEASEAAIGLILHPDRETVEDEVEACFVLNRIGIEALARGRAQVERYRATGIAPAPLTEHGAILFNHRHPALAPAMELWWDEFYGGVWRDQISLPWVRAATGLPAWYFDTFRKPNPYLAGPFRHRATEGWWADLGNVLDTCRDDGWLQRSGRGWLQRAGHQLIRRYNKTRRSLNKRRRQLGLSD